MFEVGGIYDEWSRNEWYMDLKRLQVVFIAPDRTYLYTVNINGDRTMADKHDIVVDARFGEKLGYHANKRATSEWIVVRSDKHVRTDAVVEGWVDRKEAIKTRNRKEGAAQAKKTKSVKARLEALIPYLSTKGAFVAAYARLLYAGSSEIRGKGETAESIYSTICENLAAKGISLDSPVEVVYDVSRKGLRINDRYYLFINKDGTTCFKNRKADNALTLDEVERLVKGN